MWTWANTVNTTLIVIGWFAMGATAYFLQRHSRKRNVRIKLIEEKSNLLTDIQTDAKRVWIPRPKDQINLADMGEKIAHKIAKVERIYDNLKEMERRLKIPEDKIKRLRQYALLNIEEIKDQSNESSRFDRISEIKDIVRHLQNIPPQKW